MENIPFTILVKKLS